jgi:hypothetical protein
MKKNIQEEQLSLLKFISSFGKILIVNHITYNYSNYADFFVNSQSVRFSHVNIVPASLASNFFIDGIDLDNFGKDKYS